MGITIREINNYLFDGEDLGECLARAKETMLTEINKYDSDYILTTDINKILEHFKSRYNPSVPVLEDDNIYISDSGEQDVDVNRDYESYIQVVKTPQIIKGTYVEFAVPFKGISALFRLKPSHSAIRQMKPTEHRKRFTCQPYGALNTRNNELLFKYTRIDHNKESIEKDFHQDLDEVKEYLKLLSGEISRYNNEINALACEKFEERKQKLLADQRMIQSFNYPIRKYDDAQKTYSIPIQRKTIAVERQRARTGSESHPPEPSIKLDDYDEIIKTISNMALVIERNPKAFRNLDEEDIRTFILMFLNGYYKGNATGETFNFGGKTDILIRVEDRNIFIAECKFWSGPAGLTETINQLLGYASWRDNKTAIIFFNRNKNLSSVIDKIPDAVTSHSNFKRKLNNLDETTFRFVFHQMDDKDREIYLTILIFHMPID